MESPGISWRRALWESPGISWRRAVWDYFRETDILLRSHLPKENGQPEAATAVFWLYIASEYSQAVYYQRRLSGHW